jgi:hypothetical protein
MIWQKTIGIFRTPSEETATKIVKFLLLILPALVITVLDLTVFHLLRCVAHLTSKNKDFSEFLE